MALMPTPNPSSVRLPKVHVPDLRKPLIRFTFTYLLVPLNLALSVWIVLMNDAYIYPTARSNTLLLRKHGKQWFDRLYLFLIIASVLVGMLNVFIVYSSFKDVPRRTNRFKNMAELSRCPDFAIWKFYGILGLLLIGSYAVIASVAFRDVWRVKAWGGACDGYKWMADVTVVRDFPRYGSLGDPVYDASSTVRFLEYGVEKYRMDMIRAHNQSLGFGVEGSFSFVLRTGDLEKEARYFNTTDMIAAEGRGELYKRPGPIAAAQYWLHNSTYLMTLTNTSAPGLPALERRGKFTATTKELGFPDLRLKQANLDRNWRFTEDMCLPPYVTLKDPLRLKYEVVGGMAKGCHQYRICAVRNSHPENSSLVDFVQDVWPVSIAPVVWEFENYSLCCRRGE